MLGGPRGIPIVLRVLLELKKNNKGEKNRKTQDTKDQVQWKKGPSHFVPYLQKNWSFSSQHFFWLDLKFSFWLSLAYIYKKILLKTFWSEVWKVLLFGTFLASLDFQAVARQSGMTSLTRNLCKYISIAQNVQQNGITKN